MRLSFTIWGEPQRKQRPRVTRHGTYTPKATMDYERQVGLSAQDVMRRKGVPMFTGPIVVGIDVRLCPPKSFSKRKRAEALALGRATYGRADLDNYVKAILDGMNGVVMTDDRLIVEILARKLASETLGVDVTVEAYPSEQARPDPSD